MTDFNQILEVNAKRYKVYKQKQLVETSLNMSINFNESYTNLLILLKESVTESTFIEVYKNNQDLYKDRLFCSCLFHYITKAEKFKPAWYDKHFDFVFNRLLSSLDELCLFINQCDMQYRCYVMNDDDRLAYYLKLKDNPQIKKICDTIYKMYKDKFIQKLIDNSEHSAFISLILFSQYFDTMYLKKALNKILKQPVYSIIFCYNLEFVNKEATEMFKAYVDLYRIQDNSKVKL